MWKPKKAEPIRVRTPLPSEQQKQVAKPLPDDPFLRARNEDDDGYDPYSDRPEKNPFFEENPWS